MSKIRKDITIPNSGGKRITLRADSDAEMDKLIIKTQIQIEEGFYIPNGNTTFERYANQWVETYKNGVISDKQYKQYKSILRLYLIPKLGKMKMKNITQSHCINTLHTVAGMSKSQVSKVKITLSQIFDCAIGDRIITAKPFGKLQMPNYTDGTHRSITDNEYYHILRVAKNHRAGVWVLVMLYCSPRPIETRKLQWTDIDFDNGVINFYHKTKTAAGVRQMLIPDDLLDMLYDLKKRARSMYVFTQLDGVTPSTESSMRCMWESFKKALDIDMGAQVYRNQIVSSVVAPDLTPYCLRHTYATDLQAAGVPINIAKVLMGHSDVKVTGNVYSHFTPENQATVRTLTEKYRAEKLERLNAQVRQKCGNK